MNHRILLPNLLLAAAVAAVLAPQSARATGDYNEEPLTTLPSFLKLDQLPAKTFQQILAETHQAPEETEAIDLEKEFAAIKDKPGKEVLAEIDKLVVRARNADDIPSLKVLNDLRDLYAGPANAAETAEYVAWRVATTEFTEEDLDARIKKSSPALRPHYLYLRGAALFLDHKDADCQVWWEKILKEFPKHPRAEIALYMMGRSQVSRGRAEGYMQNDRQLVPAQRPRGKQLLDQYLAKYPKGRWAGDALGWLGAWNLDGGDYAAALRCYLGQLDMPDHPELAGTAAIQVETTLSHLASAPSEKAWAEVAKDPRAAQGLVYLVINSTESDNYNGEFDSAETVQGWRKKLLPQVAAAIAKQEQLYKGAEWRPRYLATLALAASGVGQQEQAIKLLATVQAGSESDDVLLARGVAMQRARRSAEAIAAFRQLLEKFPESPLVIGARLRLGMSLADNHQAGQAILELDPLIEKPEGQDAPAPTEELEEQDPYPIYTEVAANQVRQLIDFYLNFAPVEELAAPTKAPNFDAVKRLRFTEAIAQRLLAKEQFDEAKKYLTPAQFGLVAGPIEKLTITAREAKDPAARGRACLALADAWADARGKLLTYPLDSHRTRETVYPNEESYAAVRRADSATALGYPGNFRLDLENRDELRHAFNWWLEASDAQPGSATTATALWRALRAMPLIADVSPFTYERARSRKWEDVSRKLYDRLRSECADSPESQRFAVYWNFPTRKKQGDEFEGDGFRDAAGAEMPVFEALGIEEGYADDQEQRKTLDIEVQQLVAAARAGRREDLQARMEKALQNARTNFTNLYQARWINFYEDLALFFSIADVSPEICAQYVELRAQFLAKTAIGGGGWDDVPSTDEELRKQIATALKDPATKPVADFYEFLEVAITANHFTFVKADNKPKEKEAEVLEKSDDGTYRTRDYPLMAKQAAAFLEKYPQSKKREAALLLHARALYRASEEIAVRNFVTWPQGTRWEGGYLTTVTAQEKFDAKRVLTVLDAYDKAFPNGRYAADIRDYRAAVFLRVHDWQKALALTISQFDDPKRVDLREGAGTRLLELFDQLSDERYRADLLPVIKAQPRAVELLSKYLAYENTSHPLRYMSAWVKDQLAKK